MMIYVFDGKNYVLGKYRHAFKNFFKDELKDEKTLYTDKISGKKRDELIRWHYCNMNRFNFFFYKFFFIQKSNEFHILQSFDKNHKIVVSHRYYENAGKKVFLRYCQYVGKKQNFIDIS